jgi:NAD+ synthase
MDMTTLQRQIIETLGVQPVIDPKEEIRKRVDLLKQYVKKAGAKGYVLGLSGGQDSTLSGKLAQMAIDELNEEMGSDHYLFIAMRLPYGMQRDEQDAQDAIRFIQPTKVITINIKAAVDAAYAEFQRATGETLSDYHKGNIKARERMKAQYDVAAHYQCLVIGTDHAAEAITGFFTKHGDGACDITPIYGLNKRQGKMLLKELGCPEHLYLKKPTADLEDLKPGLPDEEALGFTYDNIDDYLEGRPVEPEIARMIESRYLATEHKRRPPVSIFDTWWKA